MTDEDFEDFALALEQMMAALSPTTPTALTESALVVWFKVLAPYSREEVLAGMESHLRTPRTGRTLPIPGDIVGQIERSREADGRPAPDEAWALAVTALDETRTIVWTDDIAGAFAVARSVLARGDEVGARMAFRDAYTRLTKAARASRQPVRWLVSEGHDPRSRLPAIELAMEQGRVPHNLGVVEAIQALPTGGGPTLLLSWDGSAALPDDRRALVRKLRDDFVAGYAAGPSRTVVDRQRDDHLKAVAAARVDTLRDVEEHRVRLSQDIRGVLSAVMARPNRPRATP